MEIAYFLGGIVLGFFTGVITIKLGLEWPKYTIDVNYVKKRKKIQLPLYHSDVTIFNMVLKRKLLYIDRRINTADHLYLEYNKVFDTFELSDGDSKICIDDSDIESLEEVLSIMKKQYQVE